MSTEKTKMASSFKVTKKGIEELVELLKEESAMQWKIGDWLRSLIPRCVYLLLLLFVVKNMKE